MALQGGRSPGDPSLTIHFEWPRIPRQCRIRRNVGRCRSQRLRFNCIVLGTRDHAALFLRRTSTRRNRHQHPTHSAHPREPTRRDRAPARRPASLRGDGGWSRTRRVFRRGVARRSEREARGTDRPLSARIKKAQLCWASFVREKGVEPSRLAAPEPKSGASANSATRARDWDHSRRSRCPQVSCWAVGPRAAPLDPNERRQAPEDAGRLAATAAVGDCVVQSHVAVMSLFVQSVQVRSAVMASTAHCGSSGLAVM